MNGMKLSEMMNGLPDDMILAAYTGSYRTAQTESAADFAAGQTVQQGSTAGISAPRWITAAALAACMLFAVFAGALLLLGHDEVLKSQNAQDNVFVQEVTTTYTDISAVTAEQTTQSAYAEALTEVKQAETISSTETDAHTKQSEQPETVPSAKVSNPTVTAAAGTTEPADSCVLNKMNESVSESGTFPASAAEPENALLKKYADKFNVIEQTAIADSAKLQDESYMLNKVYAEGILYSAYLSGYFTEYDWTEYVECTADETAGQPRLFRNYHNCVLENGFYYSVHDGNATVHGADTGFFADAESIAIPEMLGGYPVREIAPHAFDGFEGAVFPKLHEIIIPDSVEVICSRAFYGVFTQERCKSLSDRLKDCRINIPQSVRYFGEYAYGFGTVRALGTDITLPDTLEYIDRMAFTDNSVQIELFDDPAQGFTSWDAIPGKAPFLLTDDGYVPVPDDFYPKIEMPDTVYVCNDEYIIVQRSLVKSCQNALCPKQFAAYYVRENLSHPDGDFNSDGRVNRADVNCLQRYLLDSAEAFPVFPTDWKAGDMNDDEKLNAVDLSLIKQLF
ncbi:MAG: hypothetical protein IKG82_10430 [Oscillospiraceae bacterium]|nr:hypothetical protein [Oscillospiraceae bacterium]